MIKITLMKDADLISEIDFDNASMISIGRSEDCDIQLDDFPGISRNHLRLTYVEGMFTLEKLSSSGKMIHDGENKHEVHFDSGSITVIVYPYTIKFETTIAQEPEIEEEPEQAVVEMTNIMVHKSGEEENHLSSTEDENDVGDNEATQIAQISSYDYIFKIFKGKSFLEDISLDGSTWVFGRSQEVDYTIKTSRCSRKHFTLMRINNKFYVKDLGSSNGTYLNKRQLPVNQEVEIKSGDIIEVSDHKFVFEIQDKAFSEKVKRVDQSLSATSDQENLDKLRENALVVGDEALLLSGNTEEKGSSRYSKAGIIRLALIAVIVGMTGFFVLNPQKKVSPEQELKKAEAEKRRELELQAVDHYNLALRFFSHSEFDRCLNELDSFDSLGVSPSEVGSTAELRVQCESQKEVMLRKEDEKIRERKRREMEQKVAFEIEKCEGLVDEGSQKLKECLSTAQNLDPSNEIIQDLIDQAELIEMKEKEKKAKAAAYSALVRKGKSIYNEAKKWDQAGNWKRAIKTYKKFIGSKYPDPGKFKVKARREISSINSRIDKELSTFVNATQDGIQKGDYKSAVLSARKGLKINRDHKELLKLKSEAENELNARLRTLYQESIIDEDFGQIDQAKSNWKKILNQGVPGTEYYQKAKKKMKIYEGS